MNTNEISQHLTNLAELAQDIIDGVTVAQEKLSGETPADPLAAAYDYRFSKTYNGNLDEDEIDALSRRWHAWVSEYQPETRETYVSTGRPVIWVKVGGIEVQQRSPAHDAFRQIQDLAYSIAADNAMALRKAAGWTGRNYLTAPDGRQKSGNGQYFGPFTRPSDLP